MEEKKQGKALEWVKSHYWLLAITSGVLVLLGLVGPQLSAKPISAEFADGWWNFSKAGSRESVYLNQFFSPFCFFALLPYILVLVGITFSSISSKKGKLYILATFSYLIAGILFLIGNSLFDLSRALYYNGLNPVDYGASSLIESIQESAGTKLSFGFAFSAILSFFAALVNFSAATQKEQINIRDMSEVAVLSAVAIGLDFIKIPIGQTGGSINLALVPLFLVALRHGPTKGFLASGLVYGLITCITDGYGLFTYPFDYLIGFGGIAMLGLFRNLIFKENGNKTWSVSGFLFIALGVVIATFVRFVGSSVSSMVNYGYSFSAALQYNAIYVPVSGAVSLAAMELLYIPVSKINKRFPVK